MTRRWYWSGDLCRYRDGVIIERMSHSAYLSSPSPAVVLAEDYERMKADRDLWMTRCCAMGWPTLEQAEAARKATPNAGPAQS